MTIWHEDDSFWECMAPFMFDRERWAGTPDEVDQIEALLDIGPGLALLDLGCGPGRHSLELARRGFRVTGVDRTAVYLDRARRAAAEAGLGIELIQEDMRRFLRPDAFDVALSLYTTFGYFEDPRDNLLVLANVRQSLKEGGAFVLELMGKEVLGHIFTPRDWQERDGALFLQERSVERDWSWMHNRWILVDEQGRSEYDFGHWIYSAAELREMLQQAGFGRVICYGDLAGHPYDQTARRLVAVAHR